MNHWSCSWPLGLFYRQTEALDTVSSIFCGYINHIAPTAPLVSLHAWMGIGRDEPPSHSGAEYLCIHLTSPGIVLFT